VEGSAVNRISRIWQGALSRSFRFQDGDADTTPAPCCARFPDPFDFKAPTNAYLFQQAELLCLLSKTIQRIGLSYRGNAERLKMENNKSKNSGNHNPSAIGGALELLKSRKFLIYLGIFLVVATAWVVYKSISRPLSPSFGEEAYEVIVPLYNTADYGDELKIKVVRITPASHKVDGLVTYKKVETMTFNNAKEGTIITYPPENGYDIKIVRVEDDKVTFSITKAKN
jgi:hypothetical protein